MRCVFTIIHEKSRIDRVEHLERASLPIVTLQPHASVLLMCILLVITPYTCSLTNL
ncbi:hypothetical protein [Reticulibacter mediterranei]|uniref:hypothetical protein n=1 Tax=Reticulibacter mediterranei TaxID=2778369 RepID=UPI001C68A343|nr:hypothetical protein [Reticulibacter mediterranei]